MKKLFLLLSFLFLTSTCFAQEKNITPIANTKAYKVTLGEANDEVIIGDKNASQFTAFKPQITFTKWKDKSGKPENSLTIKPLFDIPNAVTSLIGNKIEHKGDKIGWYANPDPDNSENLKFGLILYEKPATNVFQFQLEGWEEFDFFYQPPLKNQNPDGSTWEDNGYCGINKRPVEVNGSYAVYHKTKANHIIGQVNYGCGKFGHYYRPRLLDADGKFVCWVDLHIENGVYTLTVDQKILDTAKYPLKFNDWFGTQGIGGTEGDASSGYGIVAKAITNPTGGTLTSISHYIRRKGVNDLLVALYSDVSGTPTTRLAYTSTGTACPAADDWCTTDISYGSLTATQYWLGAVGSTSVGFYWHYDDGTKQESYKSMGTTWPDPWSGTFENRIPSAYATYTPAGGVDTATVTFVN